MGFFNPRKPRKSYDLLRSCSWYTPGVGGMFVVLGWFLGGMLLAGLVCALLIAMGLGLPYIMLIMYPLQFLPLLIFVKFKSTTNAPFDDGYSLDSNHFGGKGILLTVLAVAGTLAASVLLEAVNHFLPEVSEDLKKTLEALSDAPLWISLLCTAVFAPFFEEWMCRGIVLRGLLNNGKKPLNPALAIVISAFFFAAIHGNLWQGITAFLIGCLLGYVYYRTGSLKLTMLMHCANNTLSIILGHFGSQEVRDAKSLLDMISLKEYLVLFAISAVILFFFIRQVKSVHPESRQGNCDIIPRISS